MERVVSCWHVVLFGPEEQCPQPDGHVCPGCKRGPHTSPQSYAGRYLAWLDGLTDNEAAEQLGIPRKVYTAWRNHKGLPCHSKLERENRERMRLYEKGLNDQEIGRERGVPGSAIYSWRTYRGLPANAPQGRPVSDGKADSNEG